MMTRLKRFSVATLFVASLWPAFALAAPFGGQVGYSAFCYNFGIYDVIGPPKGGFYIFTPQTRSYPYGLPTSGKWVLGLSGIPYFCIISIQPLIVFPGIAMTMVGTSH